MNDARSPDGRPIPTCYAEMLLAMERGYKHELFLREAGFFVTLKHADSMPDTRIDAFLAVNDGGYPFLLGFVREGLGIRLVFNCYIHASLSRELQGVREVEVVEIAQGVERKYRTELLHSFD